MSQNSNPLRNELDKDMIASRMMKFKVKFRMSTPSNSIVEDFENIFRKFNRRSRYNCLINCHDLGPISKDLLYHEEIYELLADFTYDRSVSSNMFESLCTHWCLKQKKKSSLQWLTPLHDLYFHDKKPCHRDVETREFAFGTLPDMSTFMCHFSYTCKYEEATCSFNHNRKYFTLFLNLDHAQSCNYEKRTQKFDVQYKSIVRLLICDVQGADVELYFHLTHIPFIYNECKNRKEFVGDDFPSDLVDVRNQDTQQKRWERILSFGCGCKRNSVCDDITKIGKALVFKLVLSGNYRVRSIIERLRQKCDLTTEFCYTFVHGARPGELPKLQEDIPPFFHFSQYDTREYQHLMFDCCYAWESVFSRTLEIRDQIDLQQQVQIRDEHCAVDYWSTLRNEIIRYAHQNAPALANTFYHITDMLNRNLIVTFDKALRRLFNHYCENFSEVDLPSGMCMVRRVIVTPYRTVILPSAESFENRVIRDWPNASEYILRVSILDDDFSKLTFFLQYHSQKQEITRRIVGNRLLSGICIGSRVYKVLASSNSQLREHGLWMYAKDCNQKTANDIRHWMGDFSHIKNVAKYMARMGQCFSTSDEAIQITLTHRNEMEIDDYKTLDRRYTYSDGIGKISPELAREIHEAKLKSMNVEPGRNSAIYDSSAFQIRYKGCKGMLATDVNLGGRMLAYRPSMNKFRCNASNKLEIVKFSAPRQMYLNRPLITILEQLGISANVFLNLQNDMIIDLTDSLIYEPKAAEMLDNLLSVDIPFKKLQAAGIHMTEEPFFRSLLIAVYKNSIDKLRTKARILIPPKYGRNMLGVLDETRTLNYGEVFVQYSEGLGQNTSRTRILEGVIVVTKNPCMHPGDVRKFRAVDVPQLHHIKDCIVFPAVGPRPHPDEMAGSDLDGDEFVVIWMTELIFGRHNHIPMEYPASQEQILHRKIEVPDMVEFLCEYIQNDNIGTFANAHLAWADHLHDGIFSNKCIKIAKKYPFVLDFAKTGKTEYLERNEKASSYPDFMAKGCHSNNYRSRRALGLLYRFIRNLESCVSKINIEWSTLEFDPQMEFPGWEEHVEWAQKHHSNYVQAVTRILNKYGILTEAEAISGFIGDMKQHVNRQEMYNIVTIVRNYLTSTIRKYRHMFLQEIEQERKEKRLDERQFHHLKLAKASAWYMVTYRTPSTPILSFAWIVGDVLTQVRQEYLEANQVPYQPVESWLLTVVDDELIRKYFSMKYLGEDCPCMSVMKSVISEWMAISKLSLNMMISGETCPQCFNRVFEFFINSTDTKCCSFMGDACLCSNYCSPSKVIMDFLKFYLTNATALGKCQGHCKGFRDFHLQTVALQTYIRLAVTKNTKHLGLMLESTGGSHPDKNDGLVEEGDPLRISVDDDILYLFKNHMDIVKDELKKLTQVKEIEITVEIDQHDNHYVLVSSTGTSWQRWDLEELVMDSTISQYLGTKLNLRDELAMDH